MKRRRITRHDDDTRGDRVEEREPTNCIFPPHHLSLFSRSLVSSSVQLHRNMFIQHINRSPLQREELPENAAVPLKWLFSAHTPIKRLSEPSSASVQSSSGPSIRGIMLSSNFILSCLCGFSQIILTAASVLFFGSLVHSVLPILHLILLPQIPLSISILHRHRRCPSIPLWFHFQQKEKKEEMTEQEDKGKGADVILECKWSTGMPQLRWELLREGEQPRSLQKHTLDSTSTSSLSLIVLASN